MLAYIIGVELFSVGNSRILLAIVSFSFKSLFLLPAIFCYAPKRRFEQAKRMSLYYLERKLHHVTLKK